MSIESANAFILRMNKDAEFSNKVREQSGKEQIVSFLIHSGFEFSEEEYRAAYEQQKNSNELTDAQLGSVQGGAASGYSQNRTSAPFQWAIDYSFIWNYQD